MNNLLLRTITGLTGIAILITGIVYREETFLMILILISVFSLFEFYKLAESGGNHPQKGLGHALNLLIFLPPLIQNIFRTGFNLLPLVIVVPYIIFLRELFLKKEKPVNNIATTLMGIVYITLPLFCFYLLSFQGKQSTYQYSCIIGYLLILWASDVGAYFAGRFLGRHKLFERISPKKTWEGFAGGAVLSLATAAVISRYSDAFPFLQWMIISLIVVITGSLGDLVESMFKRSVDMKDSGSMIPGHGGFMDRFDSLFISAPFVFFYLQMWR